jgi:pyridoxamine 5'-phosphate oxidase
VFYTNYKSRKALQIQENAKVSILFPWYALERQVCIQGVAEKVSTATSLKYFTSRPHGSQLGAWVSQQSSVISSRSILEMKLAEMKQKFKEGKVPLPDFWGGYKIKPTSFEFWQGRQSRLHDRLIYEKDNADDWKIARLAP